MTDTVLDTVKLNFDADSQWVLNVVLAFIMFGIALDISFAEFKSLKGSSKSIIAGVICQFLLLPAITFLLIYLLNPAPSIALGMFMVAACPGGNVSNFITHLSKGNTALSICLTAIATILCIGMTPINFQFWGTLYQPTAKILNEVFISPFEMIKLVSLLLGLPLLLGLLVNFKFPLTAKKLAKFFKIASLLVFILLIILALYNNKDIFMQYVLTVLWIVLLHNLIAFLTGFSFAKLLGLNNGDTRTITIETGIQNSGLGLILIFTFFDGLGGMAMIAAFWGVWHLISGLLLANYWRTR